MPAVMPPTHKSPSGSSKPNSSSSKWTAPSNILSESKSSGKWVHISTSLTLRWLIISIPLVIWDTGFVLLRPWSMTGGSLHWPLWVPYELYMETDYMYGWPAIEEKNGFTGAQGAMNVLETLLYICYLYLVYSKGVQQATRGGLRWKFLAQRRVAGRPGALAVMIGFSAAIMTCSKTLLYGLNEAFSGWNHVGHNDWFNLVFVYIILNGAWLVFSAIMILEFGNDMLQGLDLAAGVCL